ncbi:MAG: transcriptional regulator [Caldisphaera sp.]|nr:MAG: transcriptional regulator [Caldisphaera sp.]
MNLRIDNSDLRGKSCESCGKTLTPEDVYTRKIGDEIHYFCCSHCADAFERSYIK